MTDSRRLTILKGLTTFLEGITTAGGYQHDLAGKVLRGVPVLSANQTLPCLSILEFPKLDEEPTWVGGQKKYKHRWDLVVQGWTAVAAQGTNPTDPTYLLLADVQKRLALLLDSGDGGAPGANYMKLGGVPITALNMSPGMVRAADENSSTPCFYLRVRVEVAETTSDPYDAS